MKVTKENAPKGTKIRRINEDYSGLCVGTIVTVDRIRGYDVYVQGRGTCFFLKNFELVEMEFPEVPFKDLTDDQKIELVSAGIRGEVIQYKSTAEKVWRTKLVFGSGDTLQSFGGSAIYRVKPSKTPRELEIERIEAEMRTLADDLSKLKGE